MPLSFLAQCQDNQEDIQQGEILFTLLIYMHEVKSLNALPLNHGPPAITIVSQYLVRTCRIVFLEINFQESTFLSSLKSILFKFIGAKPQF